MHMFQNGRQNSGLRDYQVKAGRLPVSYESKLALVSVRISAEPMQEEIRHHSKTLFVFDGPALKNMSLSEHVSAYLEWGWYGALSYWPANARQRLVMGNFGWLLDTAMNYKHIDYILKVYGKVGEVLEKSHGHLDMAKSDWELAFSHRDAQKSLRGRKIGKFSMHAHRYGPHSRGAERVVREFAKETGVEPDAKLRERIDGSASRHRLMLVELQCSIDAEMVEQIITHRMHEKPAWASGDSPTEMVMWINMDTAGMWPNTMNTERKHYIHTLTAIAGKDYVKTIRLADPEMKFEVHE